MTIDFTKHADKLFNKSFYEIREANTRYVIVYGGAGSGKSVSVHQNALIDLMSTDGDTLLIRKEATSLYNSCYTLLRNIAGTFNISHLFTWNFSNSKRQVETNFKSDGKNKHRIILSGLDDPEKIKSIAGIKKIIVEEASQLTEEDFLELDRRARGFDDIQIIFILNPISENHWVKKMFVDEDAPHHNKTTVLRYNHGDNKFIDDEYREQLENLKHINYNHYRIYCLGEWGIEDKTKKFAWAFDKDKHTTPSPVNPEPIKYDPNRLLWITFDFNVNPITCTVLQHYDNAIYGIESIGLANSDIYKMCNQIKARYPGAIFMVTGDATGQNRSAMVRDNINYYSIIGAQLNLDSSRFKIPNVNPPVEENQVLVNAVLQNYKVVLDAEKCAPLIYDLTYVDMDERKKIVKDRTSDKKYADYLDNFRYFLNIALPNYLRMPK